MTAGFRTRPIHPLRTAAVVVAILVPCAAAAQTAPAIPRVRSENPVIAQLIADASVASATFRGIVAAIDATNGIVYIESGQCRSGAQACLAHSMQAAKPHRVLRVLVNTRRDREGLMGAIGHELHHALEILHQPNITTTQQMFFHFFGTSTSITSRFETKGAGEAGARIENELRKE